MTALQLCCFALTLDGNTLFPRIAIAVDAKYILELGTGRGVNGAEVMKILPPDGRFVTISLPNPPSGDDVGRDLDPWRTDPRLTMILGDTIKVCPQVQSGVDLLYIDSDHRYAHISREWELYAPLLKDDAWGVVDDLNHNDMMRFWDEVTYDKEMVGTQGVFHYIRR